MTETAADLRRLADAVAPLNATLDDGQKRRLGILMKFGQGHFGRPGKPGPGGRGQSRSPMRLPAPPAARSIPQIGAVRPPPGPAPISCRRSIYSAMPSTSGVRQARCWPPSTAIIWPVTFIASAR